MRVLAAMLAAALPAASATAQEQAAPVLDPGAVPLAGDDAPATGKPAGDKPAATTRTDAPDAAFEALGEADKLAAANFAHCIVARHAGDMRWFALVAGGKAGVPAATARGAMQNAVNAMRVSCPATEAHGKEALTYAAVLTRFHPGAMNLPTATDPLAACVAANMPEEATRFLTEADTAMEAAFKAKADGKAYTIEPAAIMDAAFGGKLAKPCEALAPEKGALDFNEFYARVNWDKRARVALAAVGTQAPRAQTGGR